MHNSVCDSRTHSLTHSFALLQLEQELEDAKKELKKTKKKIREQNFFEHLRNSDKSKSMTKAEKLCQKRCAANHAFKEADKAFKKKRDPKGDESYEQWDMKDADITDEMVAWEETAEKKRKCQHRHDRYELRASVIALIKISCLTDRCGHFERDSKCLCSLLSLRVRTFRLLLKLFDFGSQRNRAMDQARSQRQGR